jgi:hypothetical protein
MDRPFAYIGASIYEWQTSAGAQAAMVGLGKLAQAALGPSTQVNGLPCTPTSPASLQVQVGPGEIYQIAPLEATAFGTLPADLSDTLIKQGVNLPTTLLVCAPPATAGQSINYLIEAQYQDEDVSIDPTTGNQNIVLAFYNASNPTVPWSGPNNTGQTSNTFRKGIVALQAKAGTAATTGSQVTPTADAGWVGLYVVTVANGQTTIGSGNIALAGGAPFITENLPVKISQATGDARYMQIGSGQGGAANYCVASGGPNAFTAALSPVPSALTEGMRVWVLFPSTNTAAGPTLNLNATGVAEIFEADGLTPVPIGQLPLNAELLYHAAGGGSWALLSAAPVTGAVSSFNTRAGAVTLTSGDVTTALGFTPLDRAGSAAATAKITFFTSTTASAAINIPQGAVPGTPVNGDLWTTSSGVFARIAGTTQQLATTTGAVSSFNTRTGAVTLSGSDVSTALGFTPLSPAGGAAATMTGVFNTVASAVGGAGLNIPPGTAPTTPNNGDFWSTSSGFFGRVAGGTVQFLTSAGTTTVGDFAVWNNTTGTALKDVSAATAAQVCAGNDNGSPLTSNSLALAGAELVLTDGATVTWNMAQGFNANLTLGGNRTITAPTNPIAGRTYFLRIIQPASGGPFAPVLPVNFNFMGAGNPTFSTTPNKFDAIALYCYDAVTPNFVASFIRGT